jgi:hypothetical protein
MKKFRTVLLVIFFVLMAGNLVLIDYRDIFQKSNVSELLGIFVAICGIISMSLSIRDEKKYNGK